MENFHRGLHIHKFHGNKQAVPIWLRIIRVKNKNDRIK